MPNPQPQQEPKQPPKKRDDLELDPPLDYKDEPPPVIKAESDDVAQNDNTENEGEGNKSADRNYRRGVQKTIANRNVEQDAKKAAEALDDDEERKDLEDAEEAARKGQIH